MEASELLSDTFAILSCKEIKLSTMRSKPDEDIQPDEDEMAMANAVMQAAQKKLISQVNGTWIWVGRGMDHEIRGMQQKFDEVEIVHRQTKQRTEA